MPEHIELKPCPCGGTPRKLSVVDGHTVKWAFVCGDCCGEWLVEFRTQYEEIDSEACYALAVSAWNAAPRPEEA